jgi:O-antigen ligase
MENPRALSLPPFFTYAYFSLFALSIVLMNPWGSNRGEIWTQPKVTVVVILALLNLCFLLLQRKDLVLSAVWKRAAALWACFLVVGLLSTLFSPSPLSSLRAHLEMGDGWLYWLLLAVFTLSNVLVVRLNPRLLRVQLFGVLAGGFVLALGIFPQVFDWRIDYTATSGQVSASRSYVLVSSIWDGHMPIGFFSNRGHAGFVLATAAVLALVALLHRWLKPHYAWAVYVVTSLAVVLTSTRGVWLAFAAGILYLIWRFWRQPASRRVLLWAVTPFVLSFAAFLAVNTVFDIQSRSMPSLQADLNALTSERQYLWGMAAQAISERPLIGWGFNGFGIAWAYIADWGRYGEYLSRGVPIAEITSVNNYGFSYLGEDGRQLRGRVKTNKSHNIILDTAISIGLLGLVSYGALMAYSFFTGARGSASGLEAVAVVYLIFGLTWFESAQYSHLVWWALSAGLGASQLPRQASREPSLESG